MPSIVEAKKHCDIVMKGGLTSGVVYPEMLVELSKQYSFRSIGGNSAGAIAASFAAAAEHYRLNGGDGFDRLQRYAKWLREPTDPDEPAKSRANLYSVFQPAAELQDLGFDLDSILGTAEKARKWNLSGWTLIKAWVYAPWWLFAKGNLKKFRRAWSIFNENHFGILPGLTVPPGKRNGGRRRGSGWGRFWSRLLRRSSQATSSEEPPPGLTDWMNLGLEIVAGRLDESATRVPDDHKPLLFSDLEPELTCGAAGKLRDRSVRLRLITTNLSRQELVPLPCWGGDDRELDHQIRMRVDDATFLFPPNIVRYLENHSKKHCPEALDDGHLVMPGGGDMPVLLAARLSMCFPFLFSQIPVYRRDLSLSNASEAEQKKFRREYLSDGGAASNFPIHLFDAPVPGRPTFAINLPDYLPERRGPDPSDGAPRHNRIYVADRFEEAQGIIAPTEIDSPIDVLMGVLNSAMNWQDRM